MSHDRTHCCRHSLIWLGNRCILPTPARPDVNHRLRPPEVTVVVFVPNHSRRCSTAHTCRTCHGVDFCSHIRRAHFFLSRCYQIMSSTTPLHVATMPLTFLRWLTFPFASQSQNTNVHVIRTRIPTVEPHFDVRTSLCLMSQSGIVHSRLNIFQCS